MQLYRNGNYIVRKSKYNDMIQVWNMRTMVKEFETVQEAIEWIELQLQDKKEGK